MALPRYILNGLLNDAFNPYLYDQHFGTGLLHNELPRRPTVTGLSLPLYSGYLRAMRPSQPGDSDISTVANRKDQFTVNLDVQQFKPKEISVKVVNDYVVVEGKHEERRDRHGYISRQFTRRYALPPDANIDEISSKISSDGILSITVLKKVPEVAGCSDFEAVSNVDEISSKISSDGISSITAPKKVPDVAGERQITITQTNQPEIEQPVASENSDNGGQHEKNGNLNSL